MGNERSRGGADVKIVIGEMAGQAPLAAWRERFPGVEFVPARTLEEQRAAVRDADAYLGRIPREAFLAAGPNLRWVHSSGAGIETLTYPELVESDVVLTNTRGGHAPCIADHAFALLLALTRRLPDLLADQRAHVWKRPGGTAGMRALPGATMVIVGMGNIGRQVAQRAVAFDMRVLGVDVRPGEAPAGVEAILPLERLDEALRQADVAVIAVPLTPQTRGMLDARRIGLLKPGGYLIVLSRGGIVDEPALIAALQEGRLAGAGLDVQAREPTPPDDPLWDAPNLILTPHCSPTSDLTRERVWAITEENVGRFVRGEPLINVCDKRAGF
jgi:phosphoglycerate dehydrogenase-like enzyme